MMGEGLLTEPEDRTWRRDGRAVIEELNRFAARLKEQGKDDCKVATGVRKEGRAEGKRYYNQIGGKNVD